MSRELADRKGPGTHPDRGHPSHPNPLQRLIQDRMRERGWSYADVARQGEMPRSTVHQVATTPESPQRMPQPATLSALARGLELPLDVVRDVSARAAGLQLYRAEGRDPDVAVLIASFEQLPTERRHEVVRLVQGLLEEQRGRSETTT